MNIKMELLSDVIFGNGASVPGAEDISVLCDANGFPYYKGGTFKGLLREQYVRYLGWSGKSDSEIKEILGRLFGDEGHEVSDSKFVFADFVLSPYVKKTVLDEIKEPVPDLVLGLFTNLRAFTAIDDNGVAREGSLRMARCVNKGLTFYSSVICDDADKELLTEVLGSLKWLGSMRNRGFGNVKISVDESN